jgi:hypothetical protein
MASRDGSKIVFSFYDGPSSLWAVVTMRACSANAGQTWTNQLHAVSFQTSFQSRIFRVFEERNFDILSDIYITRVI